MSENTEKIQGTKFAPGQSGNPAGKPKGARNKTTLAIEALLEGEADALTRKAIEMAKDGDGPALRMCLDRLAPPRKDSPVCFDLATNQNRCRCCRGFQRPSVRYCRWCCYPRRRVAHYVLTYLAQSLGRNWRI